MLKKSLASLVFATSLFACKEPAPQIVAIPAPVDVTKAPGQMTVVGSATLEVAPDCADLTMVLGADGMKPGVATTAVQAKQQALVAALMKLGLETADIKLSHVTLNPIFAIDKDGVWSQTKIATYRAEITITASTKRFELIAGMMDAGAQAGATSMTSQFRRSDLDQLKKQVREMALKAAREKAEATAKALGVTLGHVVAVNEAPNGYMWRNAYFPANEMKVADRPDAGGMVTLGASLQPLTLEVTVGYDLPRSV
jgi:uncharacterized protein